MTSPVGIAATQSSTSALGAQGAVRATHFGHTSPSTSRPRVALVGDLTAMTAPGGGETQLLETARALRDADVDARLWRPWEHRFDEVDVVHVFGSTPVTAAIAEAVRDVGKPVVLSPISWFDPWAMWREEAPWPRRLWRVARWWLRRASRHRGSWRRRLYRSVDALLPNSMAEASQLAEIFHVPWQRLHVVPNAADARFAGADPRLFVDRFGAKDFVLYAGRIEPRKNQATFLRAMAGAELPIIILGSAVPGHAAYFNRCRRLADEQVTFVDRLDHDDPLLASAFAAARCLALSSWFETPGLVALEAALSGTPLVLSKRGSASEYFGPMATYVDPNDESEIRRAVISAHAQEPNRALAELVRTQFSWQVTAQATRRVYEQILG